MTKFGFELLSHCHFVWCSSLQGNKYLKPRKSTVKCREKCGECVCPFEKHIFGGFFFTSFTVFSVEISNLSNQCARQSRGSGLNERQHILILEWKIPRNHLLHQFVFSFMTAILITNYFNIFLYQKCHSQPTAINN